MKLLIRESLLILERQGGMRVLVEEIIEPWDLTACSSGQIQKNERQGRNLQNKNKSDWLTSLYRYMSPL